jgi:hypothetical protein
VLIPHRIVLHRLRRRGSARHCEAATRAAGTRADANRRRSGVDARPPGPLPRRMAASVRFPPRLSLHSCRSLSGGSSRSATSRRRILRPESDSALISSARESSYATTRWCDRFTPSCSISDW